MEPLVPGLTHPAPCSHQQVTTTVASATAGAWVNIQYTTSSNTKFSFKNIFSIMMDSDSMWCAYNFDI